MKVTYIGHSGFLVETGTVNLLFDYYKGTIPQMNHDLPVIVFVSHKHEDHYNPEIFRLAEQYSNIQYFLSNDIRISEKIIEDYRLTPNFINNKVSIVSPGQKKVVSLSDEEDGKNYIVLESIKSTDQGLAFLVNVDGKLIYHAGDLNCWVWEGDTKQQFNNMSALFKRAMEKIGGREIFLAFAPLDPRQGHYYKIGMEYLLNATSVTYAVPMHLWGEYETVDLYEKERATKSLPTKIIKLTDVEPVINL